MRVERTLIALGLVLAVTGAIVAINGYIYVNVDRGPPLMISGTLLFGFGLGLAALGFMLRELQAIAADASKAALLLAKSRNGLSSGAVADPVAPAPAPPPPKPLPKLAPFEPPADARAPAKEPEPAKTSEADPFAPAGVLEKLRRSPPPALGPRPEPLAKPSTPPFSWLTKPKSVEKPAEKLPPAENPKVEDDDWLNQAIAVEAGKAGQEKQEKKDEDAPAPPPAPSPAREADQALRREFGLPEPEAAETSETPEAPAPAPAPKPEVIGNYEAHGAHYTMYADGSIEAETQHGVYRFSSIEELKRFIEGEDAEGGKA